MRSKKCVDHLGNAYSSEKEMCAAWKVKRVTYRNRIRSGRTVEEALTGSKRKKGNRCTDHLGNEYPSEAAMCAAWGVIPATYARRRKAGRSVEEALTTGKLYQGKRCKDHLGNEYVSKTAMCAAWSVNWETYKARRKSGWSIKEALTGDKQRKGKQCKDHLGNKYSSEKAMCAAWNVNQRTYRTRRKAGQTIEEALTGAFRRTLPIGLSNLQACGLIATITKKGSEGSMFIKFEDGTLVSGSVSNFVNGSIGHPELKARGEKCHYAGFEAKKLVRLEDRTLHTCECMRCGLRDMMTPQEMLEHERNCDTEAKRA